MSDKYKLNVFTNKLDLVEHIPQVSADPATPRIQDPWVRRTGAGSSDPIPDGTPIGMLLALTYHGDAGVSTDYTYDFNYRTDEGTTIRIPFDQGGTIYDITTKTDDYTATSEDNVILCNKATAMTITLPEASGHEGRVYNIKNINIGTVTVDADGSQTIDGNLTVNLAQYDSLTIISDTLGWYIL